MASLSETLERLVGVDYATKRYLIAVSGGVDSMVLLHTALDCLPPQNLVIAHYHHGTRPSAERDLKLVENTARKAKADFVHARRTPTAKKASELTLREFRRRFLKKARIEKKCDYILTAHHLNDQFETLFMRLMRGTGAKGLSGIREKNGRFIRPFLTLLKADLETYATLNKILWHEDETNRDADYLRNRVRHEVIPAFLKAARKMGTENQILSRWHETTKELALLTQSPKNLHRLLQKTRYWTRVAEKDFLNLPAFERRLLIAKVAKSPLTRPSLKRIEEAMLKKHKRFDLSQKVQGVYSCGQFFFSTEKQRRMLEKAEGDFEILEKGYRARLFQPGDRLGRTKLKKLFLESKIPEPERKLLPVVLNRKGEVVGFFPQSQLVRSDFPFSFLS